MTDYLTDLLALLYREGKLPDLLYPIVLMIRTEDADKSMLDRGVVIQSAEGEVLLRLEAKVFVEEAEKLLRAIQEGTGSFPLPEVEAFMNSIHCHTLKARSTDKTDIRIILHDRRTKMNSDLGFSIKSRLGSDSTLLNASKATNVRYRIEGCNLSDEEISGVNAICPNRNKVIERVSAINRLGGKLVFDRMDNQTFDNNLTMLDGDLPKIIGELLLAQLGSGKNRLTDLVEIIDETNPLGYDRSQGTPYYAYKLKHLLTSTALGMMPGKVWGGRYDANGGYLVVREDGEVLCYHFYDRNRFEDYLFYNAYLERASTGRHEYARVMREEDGSCSFKLNLQIRLR